MRRFGRLLIVLVLAAGVAQAGQFVGAVGTLIDGDTFWLCDSTACHKIRICAINAPERGEVGSHESKEALAGLMKGLHVRCIPVGEGTPCDGRSKPTNVIGSSLNVSWEWGLWTLPSRW